MNDKPFYRLRELIEEKYGKDKYLLGCKLVAKFLTFEMKVNYNEDYIRTLCFISATDPLFEVTALNKDGLEILTRLFPIDGDINSLLTDPMPDGTEYYTPFS